MNTYCANLNSATYHRAIYTRNLQWLKTFLYSIPRNTFFQMERKKKKRVTSSMLISLIYKHSSQPVTSANNILSC